MLKTKKRKIYKNKGTDILKWTQQKGKTKMFLRESNLECEEHGGERLEPDEPVQGECRGGVVGPVVKGWDLIVLPAGTIF